MTAGNGAGGNGRKQRLELTWIGKDDRPRLEPRILLPQADLRYAKGTPDDGGIHDNILIHGDNLLALKALEQEFAGRVKCVYIDPPYNTGSAFKQYDDGLEHSLWLSLLRDRIELLRRLLSDNGSIWISINDQEAHYLKIMLDEIFGRENFIAANVWQMIYTVKNTAKHFSAMHEYVLVYAKDASKFNLRLLPREAKQDDAYDNLDDDPRGPWKATPLHARNSYSLGQYAIVSPSGRQIRPPTGTYWRISEESFVEMQRDGRIWWGKSGDATPAQKRFLSDVKKGVTPTTLWLHADAGHNAEAKNEVRAIFGDLGELFLTPKPERLMRKVIELSTDPGDLVLDSFGGSGTTGAVAHKMGRRWIMIELGDHATTLIVPRLRKVIDGDDAGGVTEATGWKGGGGFRFFRLAPSLIEEDQFGQKVISKQYNAEMLAEAMCKHMGYTYAPAHEAGSYWQQGYSTERDFIYTTTQSMTHDALKALSLEVGPDRTLLVCCKAFRARLADFHNLTVKKIPQAVLDNCEWGRDDYSLSIAKPAEDASAGSDEGPDNDDEGNGGDLPSAARGRRRSSAPEPIVEARIAAPKRAPLKMDGTARQPRQRKSSSAVVAPPPAEPIRADKAQAKQQQSTSKSADKDKGGSKGKKKAAPVAEKPKAATKSRPTSKSKSRQVSDERQRRLL